MLALMVRFTQHYIRRTYTKLATILIPWNPIRPQATYCKTQVMLFFPNALIRYPTIRFEIIHTIKM